MSSLQAGGWQTGVGKTLHGRRIGLYGYGRIGKQVAHYARAFGMQVTWWGSDAGRARATADGEEVASSRRPSLWKVTLSAFTSGSSLRHAGSSHRRIWQPCRLGHC